MLTRIISRLSTRIINYALCSAALAANEFVKAGIEFYIINSDAVNLDDAVREHNLARTRMGGTRLLLQIPERQMHKIDFLGGDARARLQNGGIVHVPVENAGAFNDVAYVSAWSQRFSRAKVSIILPERISAFFGGPIANEQFSLSPPVQRLVAQMQLDTELFNVMCDVRNSNQTTIVFCLTRHNIIPPFARLFSVVSNHITGR